MKDLNSVMMTGHLVADPDLRYTNTGFPVMNFSLAFNRSRKVGDEWKEYGNFIDCKLYGNQAEFFAQNLHKGSFVAVMGSLDQERWQNSEGQNRSKMVLAVDSMRFMDAKPKKDEYEDVYGDGMPLYDDDMPF